MFGHAELAVAIEQINGREVLRAAEVIEGIVYIGDGKGIPLGHNIYPSVVDTKVVCVVFLIDKTDW